MGSAYKNDVDKDKPSGAVNDAYDYLLKRQKSFSDDHKSWAHRFFFCETLNLINVIVQLIATDIFLGNTFFNYGFQVIKYELSKSF